MRPLRLGVVSYLNAVPLAHGLEGDPAFEVVRDVPSRVAAMLHAGEVDLGTIPSVEYAMGDYAIVPGVAIGSRGAVRSVCLYHRRPLEEARRVALDRSSRTSAALARVLLSERLGRPLEYVDAPPDLERMLAEADAALLIGDPALYQETEVSRLDLGSEWLARTGLPFVFAFWAGRPGTASPGQVARLQAALRENLGRVREIAATYDGSKHAAINESYLRENVTFGLGTEEQAGLREFYRRAHRLGLIPREPALEFFPA
ncbi:MAG TPA: menaquinone biosynthesis protein [Vicinamibacteria bacterium]|nr:menaquinone biosynthesis protein [Vicinamibacteria bacterium]